MGASNVKARGGSRRNAAPSAAVRVASNVAINGGPAVRAAPGPRNRGHGRSDAVDADDADAAAVLAALGGDAQGVLDEYEEGLAGFVAGVCCVAVANPTAALHMAYAIRGVGPGTDVVLSPLGPVAAAAAAIVQGARVVFADVEDDTATLDPEAVAAALGPRTSAVVATDQDGHPADHDALRAALGASGAALLADAGGALGATYRGVPLGALADLTALRCPSGAGVLAVADEAYLTAARQFRHHGLEHTHGGTGGGDAFGFGLDYRLPGLVAALGLSRLRGVAAALEHRRARAARYVTLLGGVAGLRLPVPRAWAGPGWLSFPVRVLDGRRPEVYARLRSVGVAVRVDPVPVYWQPAFAELGYPRGLCPVAERIHAEQLSLPLDPELSDADQDRVADAVRAILT